MDRKFLHYTGQRKNFSLLMLYGRNRDLPNKKTAIPVWGMAVNRF